jgi:hypothetical protein
MQAVHLRLQDEGQHVGVLLGVHCASRMLRVLTGPEFPLAEWPALIGALLGHTHWPLGGF